MGVIRLVARTKSEYSPWFGPFHLAVSTRGHTGHEDHVLRSSRALLNIHSRELATGYEASCFKSTRRATTRPLLYTWTRIPDFAGNCRTAVLQLVLLTRRSRSRDAPRGSCNPPDFEAQQPKFAVRARGNVSANRCSHLSVREGDILYIVYIMHCRRWYIRARAKTKLVQASARMRIFDSRWSRVCGWSFHFHINYGWAWIASVWEVLQGRIDKVLDNLYKANILSTTLYRKPTSQIVDLMRSASPNDLILASLIARPNTL